MKHRATGVPEHRLHGGSATPWQLVPTKIVLGIHSGVMLRSGRDDIGVSLGPRHAFLRL